jgi:O-antigen/teichoic acid export membrane protein
MYKIRTFITSKINRSNERSTNTIKNIIASFGIKGVSIIVQLLLVPMTINYVNPTQYGIWLTLSSIVAWFSFLDIGFGNGLRNRFAEAKAMGDYTKAKVYVSTTYICLGSIFAVVWILFFCINFFVDWSKILNAPAQMAKELSIVAIIIFSFFCMQIVLKTINTILIADQKPAKSAFFDMFGNMLALLVIFILIKTTEGSLLYLALALGFCPILIMLISSFWLYNHEYQIYKPSFRLFKQDILKDILNLGLKFFVVQIAAILVFQSANIIIAQLFSPEDVTKYNIVYKYFTIPYSLLMIIIAPLWSAYTDAYTQNDKAWMIATLKKIRYTFIIIALVSLLMLAASSMAYKLWIGNVIEISFILSLFICIYSILLMWVAIHTYIINGIGKIKLQFIFSIAEIVTFIPVAIILGKVIGIHGIIIAMIFFVLIRSIWSPIQLKKLIFNTATGIWNE